MWDLYRFADGAGDTRQAIDSGAYPWWTSPDLKLGFFRPIPSLVRALEHELFGRVAWPGHVLSLLVYALVAYIAARFYRRVIGGAVGGLAALLYAFDDAHSLPVMWIANRYTMICTAFGVLALIAHLRAREAGRFPIAGPLALGLALLCGESGIAALAYLAAYELVGVRDAWSQRLRALAPYALAVVPWAVAYRSLAYGARGSGMYLDPLGSPLAFLGAVVERAPRLLLALFAAPPAEAWALIPGANHVLVTAGVATVVSLFAWFLARACKAHPAARWLALGTVLSVVPACAAMPDDRLLFLPGLGASGLIAIAITSIARAAWDGVFTRASLLGAGLLALLHLVLAPFLLGLRQISAMEVFGNAIERGRNTLPLDDNLRGRTLVILSTPDALMSTFMFFERYLIDPTESNPERVRILVVQNAGSATFTRDGASLVVRATDPLYSDPFGKMYRGAPLVAGEQIAAGGLTVKILETDANGAVRAVRFDFDEELETQRWVAWRGRGFVEVPIAGEGESFVVPATTWWTATAP